MLGHFNFIRGAYRTLEHKGFLYIFAINFKQFWIPRDSEINVEGPIVVPKVALILFKMGNYMDFWRIY